MNIFYKIFYRIKTWYDRVTGKYVMGPKEYIGKYPMRQDIEVIPSSEPFEGWKINVLGYDSPIEDFDDCAIEYKGTTKIEIFGVKEIDPTKFKCNGKWMNKEEMSQALWNDNWELESDTVIINGRRHIGLSVLIKMVKKEEV